MALVIVDGLEAVPAVPPLTRTLPVPSRPSGAGGAARADQVEGTLV